MAKELIRSPSGLKWDEQDRRWGKQVSRFANRIVGTVPADSTASDVAGLKADFNALLAWLRALEAD